MKSKFVVLLFLIVLAVIGSSYLLYENVINKAIATKYEHYSDEDVDDSNKEIEESKDPSDYEEIDKENKEEKPDNNSTKDDIESNNDIDDNNTEPKPEGEKEPEKENDTSDGVTEENLDEEDITEEDNTNEDSPTDDSTDEESLNVIDYTKENSILAQEIIDLYRVSVLYDSKAFYTYNGVSAVETGKEDAEKVNNYLKELKVILGYVPQSIYDTLRLEVGFSIHILKQLPDGKAGYAVFQPYGSYRMVIDIDNVLGDRIFYHELFHLMERYMYWQNGGVDPFTEWNSYNPDGFTYGSTGLDYTWGDKESEISDIAFVSTYSKTNSMEDRADLFADLMFRWRKYYYMNKGYGINDKAIYLDQVIDKYFGNFTNSRWERWISR